MIGLVIRLVILCSVVFAVVYGITRALRANVHSKESERIAEEIRALRQMIQLGEMDPTEYAVIANRIRKDCQRLGIEVPELPTHLPPRRPKD